MLVLLKADSLVRSESEEEEAELAEEELLEGEDAAGRREQLYLERQLRRRAVAQPPKRRRVTLQELIEQLQVMAEAIKDTPVRTRRRRPASGSKAQAARAIAELAHQENLSELAAALERFLQEHWLQIAGEQDWLDLEQLLERWSPNGRQSASQPHPPSLGAADRERNDHRVGVFWALLLLSAQSKVELTQEEFYRDLKIRALPQAL
jgi:segregation and condensation protein A